MKAILLYFKVVIDLNTSQVSRRQEPEASIHGTVLKAWIKARQYKKDNATINFVKVMLLIVCKTAIRQNNS